MDSTATATIGGSIMDEKQFEVLKGEILEVLNHAEDVDSWMLCFLIFFGVSCAIFLGRKLFLKFVTEQAKKTDNKVDDFVMEMVESW